MAGYSTRDVADLVGITPARVRAFVRNGLVNPRRGPGREFRYSFQDLVLIRTASELEQASVPVRRISRALGVLRQRLPHGKPLSAVRIEADGGRIVVRDGANAWHLETGQGVFEFDVADLAVRAAPLVSELTASDGEDGMAAGDWVGTGLDCETVGALEEAREAYERALALEPGNADAHINLGRLHHLAGRLDQAEQHYRHAVDAEPADATAAFNLGVVLDDLGRVSDAARAYARAVELDGQFADAHYNLAQVYERTGDVAGAIRHLARYRALAQDVDH